LLFEGSMTEVEVTTSYVLTEVPRISTA
jgi:hypothetical protein